MKIRMDSLDRMENIQRERERAALIHSFYNNDIDTKSTHKMSTKRNTADHDVKCKVIKIEGISRRTLIGALSGDRD